MKQFAFDAAKAIRYFSDCPIKVGAALEKSGRILNVACNTKGSMHNGLYEYSRHAEGRLLRNTDARGAVVYVYRSHNLNGRPLLSKPCKRCTALLLEAGVKRVYFSTPDATGWTELRLN